MQFFFSISVLFPLLVKGGRSTMQFRPKLRGLLLIYLAFHIPLLPEQQFSALYFDYILHPRYCFSDLQESNSLQKAQITCTPSMAVFAEQKKSCTIKVNLLVLCKGYSHDCPMTTTSSTKQVIAAITWEKRNAAPQNELLMCSVHHQKH